MSEAPPLSQGVAYGLVCGFGIVFALSMNGITWMSRKYLHESDVSHWHCITAIQPSTSTTLIK